MGWELGTYGWEQYDSFVRALKAVCIAYKEGLKKEAYVKGEELIQHTNCGCGPTMVRNCKCCLRLCDHMVPLRIAFFKTLWGKPMIAEEYLRYHNYGYEFKNIVGIVVYERGHRPNNVRTLSWSYYPFQP